MSMVGKEYGCYGRSVQPVYSQGRVFVQTAPSMAIPLQMAKKLGQDFSDRMQALLFAILIQSFRWLGQVGHTKHQNRAGVDVSKIPGISSC
jgi:hypothetical protein